MQTPGDEKIEQNDSAPGGEKERYFGSVRFFKHLILTIYGLLIVVPCLLALLFWSKSRGLQRSYQEVKEQFTESQEQVQQLQERLDAADQGAGNASEQAENAGNAPEQEADRKDTAEQETNAENAATDEALPEKALWDIEGKLVLLDAVDAAVLQDAASAEEEKLNIPFYVNPDDWNYILLNDTHPLRQDFTPLLADTRNGQKVDRRIRRQLEQMLDDAAKEGYELVICSSYRDYSKQEELVQESISKLTRNGADYEDAFFQTKQQIALTGNSEHHTGLAVDVVGVDYQNLDPNQGETEEAKWLAEHCCEYGFILRYPKGKEDITGINYEPWHFRYVGKRPAEFMAENNLCLEEFLDLARKQPLKGRVIHIVSPEEWKNFWESSITQ